MTQRIQPRSKITKKTLPILTLLLALSVAACAQSENTSPAPATQTAPPQKQADNKPASDPQRSDVRSDGSYVIGSDDVLAINVWKEAEVSRVVPVRSDGKISLPLVGELTAGGQTPLQLEQEITKRLSSFISEPEVTVIVQDSKSQRINILGMVARPGSYMLTGSATVLDAIAMAGGFKDFAKQKAIYVLRPEADGTQKRLLFNYKDMIKGKNPDQNIRLLPRDTVVIP
jgi:polysaccharide biosynthesis/export protein